MALRPWNVFQKTLYSARADGGHLAVTARISLARAHLKERGQQTEEGASFLGIFSILLPSSIAVWVLLWAARQRYSDEERLKALEGRAGGSMLLDVLSSRFAAHLGPYQVPNFVNARLHEEPLRTLREPLLLDHERTRALSRLEQLSMRRVSAQAIAPPGEDGSALQAIEPVFVDLLASAPQGSPDASLVAANSHQAAALRIVFDILCATPPEQRTVESWVLSGLVMAQGPPWDAGPQSEETRVALLLLLLQSPENCKLAASLREVCTFVQQLGFKQKEDTLWPLKAYLLSGETPDLLRKCVRMINKHSPGAIEAPPPKARRDTPSLQLKHDLRNYWTTALLTGSWASFCAWRGTASVSALLALGQSVGGALGGIFVLESIWRMQEWLIQSTRYFEEPSVMYSGSAAMCLLNCVAWSWAFRAPVFLPFVICRVLKDDFMDAYRVFEE